MIYGEPCPQIHTFGMDRVHSPTVGPVGKRYPTAHGGPGSQNGAPGMEADLFMPSSYTMVFFFILIQI